MSYQGLFATDGSWNCTLLSSPSSYTGLHAADGSLNIVLSPGSGYVGRYHPCGAMYITHQTSAPSGQTNPDGSLNISVSPYQSATQAITLVSGSFSPGTPGALIPLLF